jgi:hypothetical protein
MVVASWDERAGCRTLPERILTLSCILEQWRRDTDLICNFVTAEITNDQSQNLSNGDICYLQKPNWGRVPKQPWNESVAILTYAAPARGGLTMKDSWKCGGGRVEEDDGIECSSGVRRGIKGSGRGRSKLSWITTDSGRRKAPCKICNVFLSFGWEADLSFER